MRRSLTILLLAMLPLLLFAQKFSYTHQGVEFKCKVNNGTVCVTGFDVKARQVTVPAIVSYNGVDYPVKSVSTFLNGVNYLAVSLVLEEGIEDIDKFSFNEFRKLTSVSLPSTIRHIGKNAFRDNSGMTFEILSGVDESLVRKGKEVWGTGDIQERPVVAVVPKTPTSPKAVPQVEPADADVPKIPQKPSMSPKTKTPEVSREELADVDMDIPVVALNKNPNTCCVIIANENYEDVPNVDYAERDGKFFKEYCVKVLGVPEKQIRMFVNASYTDIKRALNWMESAANAIGEDARVIFYYAGHGMPGEKDKAAYLIPVDGFPKDITTCFKLSELYARFEKISSQNITVFLDACFSGVNRGSGQSLVAARGVAIKPVNDVVKGNVVVFTAASGDETALAYQKKRHGMFTYFLLRKLKETKGKVSYGDLYEAISADVKKNSLFENDKSQSPSMNVSVNMERKWKDLHF